MAGGSHLARVALTLAMLAPGTYGCARSHTPDGSPHRDAAVAPGIDGALDATTLDSGPLVLPGVEDDGSGWRNSEVVFCGEPTEADIRADVDFSGGRLRVLVASGGGWGLWEHDGAGYDRVAGGDEPSVTRLGCGSPPRVMPFGDACSIAEITHGVTRCAVEPGMNVGAGVDAMTLPGEEHWWALFESSYAPVVEGHLGTVTGRTLWSPADERFHGLWGDASFVAVAGGARGVAFGYAGFGLRASPDAPPGDYRAVHGTDRSHLFFGTADGRVVHYDDPTWQVVAELGEGSTTSGACGEVRDLWAGEQTAAFVASATRLARVSSVAPPRSIVDWPCGGSLRLTAITGDPETGDVFFVAYDTRRANEVCGPVVVLHYDGVRVRRI